VAQSLTNSCFDLRARTALSNRHGWAHDLPDFARHDAPVANDALITPSRNRPISGALREPGRSPTKFVARRICCPVPLGALCPCQTQSKLVGSSHRPPGRC